MNVILIGLWVLVVFSNNVTDKNFNQIFAIAFTPMICYTIIQIVRAICR